MSSHLLSVEPEIKQRTETCGSLRVAHHEEFPLGIKTYFRNKISFDLTQG
jgi:hypothetical protein